MFKAGGFPKALFSAILLGIMTQQLLALLSLTLLSCVSPASTFSSLKNLSRPLWIGPSDLCPYFKDDVINCGPRKITMSSPSGEIRYEQDPRAQELTDAVIRKFAKTPMGKLVATELFQKNPKLIAHFTGASLALSKEWAKSLGHQATTLSGLATTDKASPLPKVFTYLIFPDDSPIARESLFGLSNVTNFTLMKLTVSDVLSGQYFYPVIHELAVSLDSKSLLREETVWKFGQMQNNLPAPLTIPEIHLTSESWLAAVREPKINFAFASLRAFAIEDEVEQELEQIGISLRKPLKLGNINDPQVCLRRLEKVIEKIEPLTANLWQVYGQVYFLDFPLVGIKYSSQTSEQLKARVQSQLALNVQEISSTTVTIDGKAESLCSFLATPLWSSIGIRNTGGPGPKVGTW